jgi:hypothetical protein
MTIDDHVRQELLEQSWDHTWDHLWNQVDFQVTHLVCIGIRGQIRVLIADQGMHPIWDQIMEIHHAD